MVKGFDVSSVKFSTHGRIFEKPDWRDFLKAIKRSFVDPEFPPEDSSIVGYGRTGDNKYHDMNA